jgi:hypothetical protein
MHVWTNLFLDSKTLDLTLSNACLVSLELNLALVSHHPLLGFGAKILPKFFIHESVRIQQLIL